MRNRSSTLLYGRARPPIQTKSHQPFLTAYRPASSTVPAHYSQASLYLPFRFPDITLPESRGREFVDAHCTESCAFPTHYTSPSTALHHTQKLGPVSPVVSKNLSSIHALQLIPFHTLGGQDTLFRRNGNRDSQPAFASANRVFDLANIRRQR